MAHFFVGPDARHEILARRIEPMRRRSQVTCFDGWRPPADIPERQYNERSPIQWAFDKEAPTTEIL